MNNSQEFKKILESPTHNANTHSDLNKVSQNPLPFVSQAADSRTSQFKQSASLDPNLDL